ncbi:hypothetical protein MSG28_005786 [Choristoneura fumiferana]|uniref:Uncharacterized protein n=1 Tax=Choristoneura fumiferana TaxID=7141 RepID=A0ACC0L078_CHOFU|nr:hypothetical protein MSG28_005786 [Choristoneura fumiferana]
MDALDWRTAQLPFIYYNKIDWGAQPARGGSELSLPVPYAVIHHSYIPGACFNFEECQQSMQLGFPFYTREDWMAAPSTDNRPLKTPVPYVVIHHTYIPAACNTTVQCKADMRAMQQYHQSLGWGDIEELPPEKQLATTKALIALGLKKGYISPQYKLIGHKQVSSTECPGEVLLNEISTWENYTPGHAVITNTSSRRQRADQEKSILAESSENEVVTYDFPYTSRSEWDARPATEVLPLPTPVPYVVIHHSATPAACYNKQECKAAMKSMQDFHMDGRHWWDIGYRFRTTSRALGYIKPDYKLVGHRQVRETECPGQAFFDVVKTWDHWSPFPASHEDLVNVPEISDDYKDKYLKKSVL